MASGQPVKLNIFVGERTDDDFNFFPQSMWMMWVCVSGRRCHDWQKIFFIIFVSRLLRYFTISIIEIFAEFMQQNV